MTRTLQQNKRFHALIGLRKLDNEEKKALCLDVSNGRTDASSELKVEEMDQAIAMLEGQVVGSVKKMRAKVINVARDIFGMVPRDESGQQQYDALNAFLISKFKKPLHHLDYRTLVDAVTAVEKWRDSETKKMVKALIEK